MRSQLSTNLPQDKLVRVESNHTGVEVFLPSLEANNYSECDYEPFSVGILQQLIKSCECFVDVGADYGYYSLVARKQKPKITLVITETLPEKITVLKQNLKSIKTKKTFTTKVEKLAGLLKGKKKLFFRISVLGQEISILDRLSKELSKKPPLLIEFNPNNHRQSGTAPSLLLKKLIQQEYLIYFLNERSFEYWQYEPKKSENWLDFIELSGPCNILCISPAEKNRLKVIFDDLLVSKFVDASVSDTETMVKQLKKSKIALKRKISKLTKQKLIAHLHMIEIAQSSYFKTWQWLSNLMRKAAK